MYLGTLRHARQVLHVVVLVDERGPEATSTSQAGIYRAAATGMALCADLYRITQAR